MLLWSWSSGSLVSNVVLWSNCQFVACACVNKMATGGSGRSGFQSSTQVLTRRWRCRRRGGGGTFWFSAVTPFGAACDFIWIQFCAVILHFCHMGGAQNTMDLFYVAGRQCRSLTGFRLECAGRSKRTLPSAVFWRLSICLFSLSRHPCAVSPCEIGTPLAARVASSP